MTYVTEWHLYQALVECQEWLADELSQAATTMRFHLKNTDMTIHTDYARDIIENLRMQRQPETAAWRIYDHLRQAMEDIDQRDHLSALLTGGSGSAAANPNGRKHD